MQNWVIPKLQAVGETNICFLWPWKKIRKDLKPNFTCCFVFELNYFCSFTSLKSIEKDKLWKEFCKKFFKWIEIPTMFSQCFVKYIYFFFACFRGVEYTEAQSSFEVFNHTQDYRYGLVIDLRGIRVKLIRSVACFYGKVTKLKHWVEAENFILRTLEPHKIAMFYRKNTNSYFTRDFATKSTWISPDKEKLGRALFIYNKKLFLRMKTQLLIGPISSNHWSFLQGYNLTESEKIKSPI